MSEELKPCPCGTKAELHEDIKMSGEEQFWVQAASGWVGPIKSEPNDAVSAWNNRVDLANTDLNDELRKAQGRHPSREAIAEAFHDWWSKGGHAIDTEPDVSWYDKRRDFAEIAVHAVADAILEAFPAPVWRDMDSVRDTLDYEILSSITWGDAPFGITETYYRLSMFEGDYITRDMARALLRNLTDRGYCRFRRGLFTEDGEVAGSGYGITGKGIEHLKELEEKFTTPHPEHPAEQPVSVREAAQVKPLEWVWPNEYGTVCRATTPIGTYSISDDEDRPSAMLCYLHLTDDGDCSRYAIEVVNDYLEPEEAQAAAQADYERRILSAIADQPKGDE